MFLVEDDFGRHVFKCSTNTAADVSLTGSTRPSEVTHFDIKIFVEEEIFWFYVPVYDSFVVNVFDRKSSVIEKSEGKVERQSFFRINIEEHAPVGSIF